MNKRVFFILLVFLGLSGIIFFRVGNRNKTSVVTTTPTVTLTSQEVMLNAITKEFSKKYNRPSDAFIISIDTNLGDYAKGSVKFKGEGGGGLWFGAKVNDSWQLVYDGNGIITCSDLQQYPDFPSSLIPQCFDDSKNMLIKR